MAVYYISDEIYCRSTSTPILIFGRMVWILNGEYHVYFAWYVYSMKHTFELFLN